MSRLEDDQSILAMESAGMSTGSIAFTMVWTDRRVERRLAELHKLAAEAAEAVTAPRVPVTPERAPHANPVRTPAPKPAPCPQPRKIPDGEGVVTRTFHLFDGGKGAAVLLDDHRIVFTEIGSGVVKRGDEHHTIAPPDQIEVLQDPDARGGRWMSREAYRRG